MDRIVGKRSLLFLMSVTLCVSLLGNTTGQLTLSSSDGMPLKRAGVGQPFTLKFVATYEDGQSQEPVLEGASGLVVQRTGFQMSTMNRVSRATYTYSVRAKKQGIYTIGPVRYVQGGKEHTSNTVTVRVGADQEIDTHAVNSAHKHAFARLTVSKPRAYVGEKITYNIRFYYQDPSTEVDHMVRPAMDAFNISDQRAAHAGREKINDDVYRYIEWSWDLYPSQVGEHSIDAHRLDFTQMRNDDDRFSRLSMFLGPRADHKRVYTNSAMIQVEPLPPHDGHVVGIGSFKNFRATIEPALSKEGEAMVLTLALEGDANFDAITIPALQNMPEVFRSYPSKQYQRTAVSGATEKVFEFIVQGMKAGNWEIPSQECSFFDVGTGHYKRLHTSPLSVTVLPSSHAHKSATVSHDVDTAIDVPTPDELFPVTASWGATCPEYVIPFSLLFVLAFLPFAYMVGRFLLFKVRARFDRWRRVPSRRGYFKQARAALHNAQSKKNASLVYPVFVTLVAGIEAQPQSVVTQNYLLHMIDDERWRSYIAQAAEYAFYTPKANVTAFFNEGFVWMDRLEKK